MTTESLPVLAILGGTGDLGTGLARRWAQAGYRVIIGSRTLEKAEAAVADLQEVMAERGVAEVSVEAMENLAAAEASDIVTLTVPFSHQASTLEYVKPALQGKILIDVTVPLVPPKVARVQLPEQGSAGQIAQELLGENVAVVSAFQTVNIPLWSRPFSCPANVSALPLTSVTPSGRPSWTSSGLTTFIFSACCVTLVGSQPVL